MPRAFSSVTVFTPVARFTAQISLPAKGDESTVAVDGARCLIPIPMKSRKSPPLSRGRHPCRQCGTDPYRHHPGGGAHLFGGTFLRSPRRVSGPLLAVCPYRIIDYSHFLVPIVDPYPDRYSLALDLAHNFMYITCTLIEAVAFTQLTRPVYWYAWNAFFAVAVWVLFVLDLRIIRDRIKAPSGPQAASCMPWWSGNSFWALSFLCRPPSSSMSWPPWPSPYGRRL